MEDIKEYWEKMLDDGETLAHFLGLTKEEETQTHWDNKDFKAWCEQNNKDFDKWLSRVGYHFMRSIWHLDDVETVEEFEEFATDIYRTFDY